MNPYSDKVMEHFRNPHNMGRIDNPDGVGKVGNPVCGDLMHLYIKVNDQQVIEEIGYETFGCVAAIATSSMITDLIKGKTIDEAMKLTTQDIVDSLGGLPQIKIHCSLLAIDALKASINDYLSKK